MLGVILDTPEYFLLGILSISILFYCLIVLMSTRVTQVSRKFYFYNPSLFVSASILITSVCLLVVYVIADTGGLWEYVSIRFKFFVVFFFTLYMITLLINHRLSVHLPVEFVVHGYFVFVSSIIMVSATDFLSIFLSMEAQAIAVIFAIALDANNRKATEAAWRYFLMNGIATGVMLLGMVFVVLGGSSFSIDPFFLCLHGGQSLYITKTMWVGFLFIIIGLSIKLGVAPFQWWLPPVYEGLSGMTLALVGVVAKVAQVGILVKLALITNQCSWISNFFAAAGLVSVLIGGLGILHSFLIRHQVAFLSIYSSGILYLFFAYLDKYTLDLLIFYFLTSNLLLFSYIFLIGLVAQSYSQLKTLWDFKTLIHAFPGLPFFFVIVLIGMLGLPPLVGFLPKYLFLHTLSLHLQYFYIIIFLFSTALVIFVVVDLFKEMFFQLPGSSEVWSVVRLRNRQLGLWNSLLLSVIVVLVFYLAIILSGMFLVGGF